MDVSALILWLIALVALTISVVSWIQLQNLLSPLSFWGVIIADVTLAPLGTFAPWLCSRQRHLQGQIDILNFYMGTALTLIVSCTIVCYGYVRPDEQGEPLPAKRMFPERLVRAIFVAFGMAMAVNIMLFLLHYFYVREAGAIHKAVRKLGRRIWIPEPRLQIVSKFEDTVSGDCAICLDELACLPPELSAPPSAGEGPPGCRCTRQRESLMGRGLLRLPCGHVFHGQCVDGWFAHGESRCPCCRQRVGSLRRCMCICLPARKPRAWAWGSSVVPSASASEYPVGARMVGRSESAATSALDMEEGSLSSGEEEGAGHG